MRLDRVTADLLTGCRLTADQAQALFLAYFRGKVSREQMKMVLLLLAARGETDQEILGCLKAVRVMEPCLKTPLRSEAIDTCGTGGDGSHSINVSTLAAFLLAGGGVVVAKHGNRSISSSSGSSDLMESLGVKLDAAPRRLVNSLRKNRISYFHAPFFHPVFARIQPLRRELRVRTIFNLLGPLLNPVRVSKQVVGVSRPELISVFARVLASGRENRALVCHSRDGLDEISTAALTDYAFVHRGSVRRGVIDPARFGFKRAKSGAYRAASGKKAKDLALELLKGRLRGPVRDLVVINAAAGFWVAGRARNLDGGIRLAEEALESGAALGSLRRLVQYTHEGSRK